MADGIGVNNRSGEGTSSTPSSPARGGAGAFIKKNKLLVYGGGGLAVILMLGHKGSSAGGGASGTPQDQLQAQSDALAAQQAALESGSVIAPGGGSGGGGGGDAGPQNGLSDTTGNASAPPADVNAQTVGPSNTPVGPINITVNNPGTPGKAHPKPAGAPKHTKPKPATKHGKQNHPSHGHQVENPHAKGHGGHGVTVHGRTFPGARSHTIAPGRRMPNGDTHHDVTVHHGGHTETHTSVNSGQHWIDNVRGKNPPSRGVPRPGTHDRGFEQGHPVHGHPAPKPAHKPVVHKPVPKPAHKPVKAVTPRKR